MSFHANVDKIAYYVFVRRYRSIIASVSSVISIELVAKQYSSVVFSLIITCWQVLIAKLLKISSLVMYCCMNLCWFVFGVTDALVFSEFLAGFHCFVFCVRLYYEENLLMTLRVMVLLEWNLNFDEERLWGSGTIYLYMWRTIIWGNQFQSKFIKKV